MHILVITLSSSIAVACAGSTLPIVNPALGGLDFPIAFNFAHQFDPSILSKIHAIADIDLLV
ncbi:hypothetical protein GGH94_005042 [Coemansia aciculifera]|uniref:Uncharacterized protein n=2 Tax=Coemansia TaxID=4863 RepID=A0A9W8H0T5_9FUNG|nr:hypothetical protein GGI19_003220 [Coemansia pectinata]KAJ2861224.1 hypothetical protein GGH94_005042 [Coemansia aciculifera]KAJ2871257.1 hypothetical protein GGH93_004966 [Coemansia aciculifera]